MQRVWEVESCGIGDPLSTSPESTLILPFLTFDNGCYKVGLPRKSIQPGVSDHLSLCQDRLRSLLSELQCQPLMLSEYNYIIRKKLSQGIVAYVDDQEKPQSFSGNYHYLPHHGVILQESKTTSQGLCTMVQQGQ